MKLIQLNCWCGRIISPLARFLEQEKPDILCLQEAVTLEGGDSVVFLTTDEIQKIINAKSIFISPVFSFGYMKRRANFGNCIISKRPIIKSETIFTADNFMENLDFAETEESNMRNLQHAVVELGNGKKLNLLNHHGYHIPDHKNGNDETIRQCKIIADYAASLEGPVILTGDFNLAPSSKSIKQIDAVLDNLTTKNNLKSTRTSLTHKTEAVDYIFVNKYINVKEFRAADEPVSDHKALILEFDI